MYPLLDLLDDVMTWKRLFLYWIFLCVLPAEYPHKEWVVRNFDVFFVDSMCKLLYPGAGDFWQHDDLTVMVRGMDIRKINI